MKGAGPVIGSPPIVCRERAVLPPCKKARPPAARGGGCGGGGGGPRGRHPDGRAENFVLLGHPAAGGVYTASRNAPAALYPAIYSGNIGFVCEYD